MKNAISKARRVLKRGEQGGGAEMTEVAIFLALVILVAAVALSPLGAQIAELLNNVTTTLAG